MDIKECYSMLGGDYESALNRLYKEELVYKFALKFLNDGSYDLLCKSLEAGDYKEAFRAAHTLKGVCQNLSFTGLYESSSNLTEALRPGGHPEISELVCQVKADYSRTVSAIHKLQSAMETK